MLRLLRRKPVVSVVEDQRKLHGRMTKLLYGHRNDSQVTPLGAYKSNWGRRRNVS